MFIVLYFHLVYIPVVCHLEDSGKWPDSVDAIQNIKTAFYIKISELLKKQFKIPSVPTEKYLDILQVSLVVMSS